MAIVQAPVLIGHRSGFSSNVYEQEKSFFWVLGGENDRLGDRRQTPHKALRGHELPGHIRLKSLSLASKHPNMEGSCLGGGVGPVSRANADLIGANSMSPKGVSLQIRAFLEKWAALRIPRPSTEPNPDPETQEASACRVVCRS